MKVVGEKVEVVDVFLNLANVVCVFSNNMAGRNSNGDNERIVGCDLSVDCRSQLLQEREEVVTVLRCPTVLLIAGELKRGWKTRGGGGGGGRCEKKKAKSKSNSVSGGLGLAGLG